MDYFKVTVVYDVLAPNEQDAVEQVIEQLNMDDETAPLHGETRLEFSVMRVD
jgi:hypothetical protein